MASSESSVAERSTESEHSNTGYTIEREDLLGNEAEERLCSGCWNDRTLTGFPENTIQTPRLDVIHHKTVCADGFKCRIERNDVWMTCSFPPNVEFFLLILQTFLRVGCFFSDALYRVLLVRLL